MKPGILKRIHGFTLIELLIVVAIIAILAAIAVPNFLEAQTRSKVSRAKTDMRSVATALESYFVDNNRYVFTDDLPDEDGFGNTRQSDMLTVPDRVTTPIAYLSSHIVDVFRQGANVTVSPSAPNAFEASGDPQDMTFLYLNMRQAGPEEGDPGLAFGFFTSAESWQDHHDIWDEWRLSSLGPFQVYPGGDPQFSVPFVSIDAVYDPTNGTISPGLILRTQKQSDGNNT